MDPVQPEYLIARLQLPERGPLVRSHVIFDGIKPKSVWKIQNPLGMEASCVASWTISLEGTLQRRQVGYSISSSYC